MEGGVWGLQVEKQDAGKREGTHEDGFKNQSPKIDFCSHGNHQNETEKRQEAAEGEAESKENKSNEDRRRRWKEKKNKLLGLHRPQT